MKAVGYRKSLPIDDPQSLIDIEVEKPSPQGRDLLVQVKAISVNPVDYKMRKRAEPRYCKAGFCPRRRMRRRPIGGDRSAENRERLPGPTGG